MSTVQIKSGADAARVAALLAELRAAGAAALVEAGASKSLVRAVAGATDPAVRAGREKAIADIEGILDAGAIMSAFPEGIDRCTIEIGTAGVEIKFPGGTGAPKASPKRATVTFPDGRTFDGGNAAIKALRAEGNPIVADYKSTSFSTEQARRIILRAIPGATVEVA